MSGRIIETVSKLAGNVMPNIKFFGLLHIEKDERSAQNMEFSDFSDSIIVYVNNAIRLSRSLQEHGLEFVLYTNAKQYILDLCDTCGINIVEIEFERQIKSGIRFYSAHFKIFLYEYISNNPIADYMIFLDLDVIALNKPPLNLLRIAERNVPCVYDISDQVIPAYGAETICEDITRVIGKKSIGRWYGGEFVGGAASFFRDLSGVSIGLLDIYLQNVEHIHHVGDEMVVSSALEILSEKYTIADAGTLGIIGRFWSVKTLHEQKNIKYFLENVFLLHLPADKQLISRLHSYDFCTFNDEIRDFLRVKSMQTNSTQNSFLRKVLLKMFMKFFK